MTVKSNTQSLRVLTLVFISLFASITLATIFYSKNEAMVLAFGEGAQIETLSLFPDDKQTETIQNEAKVKLESGLFTFYVGKKDGKALGYAAIETITVRTKPETLLIVLTPEGQLRNIYTLAFHEPPEYQPPENWYQQLAGKPLDDLDFNKGVQGVSGATLSTRAAVTSARKVLSFYRTMIANQDKH